MIEPQRSGHRNRAVARHAVRQVPTKKNGFRLTWILTDLKKGEPVLGGAAETASQVAARNSVHRAIAGRLRGLSVASLKDGEDRTPSLLPRDRIPAYPVPLGDR